MCGSTLVTANVTTFLMCFSNIRGNYFLLQGKDCMSQFVKYRLSCSLYQDECLSFYNSPSDVCSAYVASIFEL